MDLWKNFLQTGSVSDYLKYKENENQNDGLSRIEITNANYNQGLDNKGTNNR